MKRLGSISENKKSDHESCDSCVLFRMGTIHISTLDRALLPAIAAEGVLTIAEFSPLARDETVESPLMPTLNHGPYAGIGDYDFSAITSFDSATQPVVTEEPVAMAACQRPGSLDLTSHRSDTCKHESEAGKQIDPKLRDFVKRVFVPALVKRYILATKRERLAVLSTAKA